MRLSPALKTGLFITALCLCAQGQDTQPKGAQINEAKGIPPRAAPADYQAHGQAGTVSVAAEFLGHSVPTPEGTLSTADYVVVEAALFGPPDARLKLSITDFSLRINGKKTALPSEHYTLVFNSLKDPEWEPPVKAEPKSKTSMSGGGQRGQSDPGSTPEPVRVPIEVQRGWQQRVQKTALPEGDRALPQAGLIFFQYRGKAESIRSVELIYAGPAGNATLALQP